MSVITFASKITDERTVEPDIEAIMCKHGVKPTFKNIFTGGRRPKFQGTIADCGHDECLCFSYTPNDAAQKWNEHHKNDKQL